MSGAKPTFSSLRIGGDRQVARKYHHRLSVVEKQIKKTPVPQRRRAIIGTEMVDAEDMEDNLRCRDCERSKA